MPLRAPGLICWFEYDSAAEDKGLASLPQFILKYAGSAGYNQRYGSPSSQI